MGYRRCSIFTSQNIYHYINLFFWRGATAASVSRLQIRVWIILYSIVTVISLPWYTLFIIISVILIIGAFHTVFQLNGTHTLAENMADNVGLKQSWRAYKSHNIGEEFRLAGLKEYSNDQLFFLSYANVSDPENDLCPIASYCPPQFYLSLDSITQCITSHRQ